jgi:hypothetical protein
MNRRRRLVDRRLRHLGIGERDVLGQLRALGRKAERRCAGASDGTAAVDERIEHQAEELAAELERAFLRAGRCLAREQRQRIGEIAAGEAEERAEVGRQRAAIVEEAVDRGGDVLLVDR